MKTIKQSFFVLISILALGACKKTKLADITPDTPSDVDVYVAGRVICRNGAPGIAYWKNGQFIKACDSDAVGQNEPYPGGIAVNGADVYITGTDAKGPVYWKNGGPSVPLDLNGYDTAIPSCIGFQGNDLYIGGDAQSLDVTKPSTVYWKNGAMTVLPGSGALVYNMAINGSDVYFCGYLRDSLIGCYWKNGGQPVRDTTTTGFGIAVNGTDIYLAGEGINSLAGYAAYSKNGKGTALVTALAPRGTGTDVTAIATNGTDVYMVGSILHTVNNTYTQYPIYWKNTTATQLSTEPGYTVGICLDGSDVYIAGASVDNTSGKLLSAYYLKNGTPVQLNSAGYTIQGISGIALAKKVQ